MIFREKKNDRSISCSISWFLKLSFQASWTEYFENYVSFNNKTLFWKSHIKELACLFTESDILGDKLGNVWPCPISGYFGVLQFSKIFSYSLKSDMAVCEHHCSVFAKQNSFCTFSCTCCKYIFLALSFVFAGEGNRMHEMQKTLLVDIFSEFSPPELSHYKIISFGILGRCKMTKNTKMTKNDFNL